jgi:hypothetical protein
MPGPACLASCFLILDPGGTPPAGRVTGYAANIQDDQKVKSNLDIA